MSDFPPSPVPPGWYRAADGKWYPPQPPPLAKPPNDNPWRQFRVLPLWGQIVSWVVVGIIALGLLGAATGSGNAKKAAAVSTSGSSSSSTPSTSPPTTTPSLHPRADLTPGATFADVTKEQVCVVGYSASVRAVSDETRDRVFAEYGLTGANRGDFEVDHLISLELGGSNDIKNLWPEPLHDQGGNGAVDKDSIENQLHDLVCSGEVSLSDAQTAIVHWDTVSLAALVSTTTTTTTTPAPTTVPATVPVTEPPTTAPPATSGNVYYANCTAARAAGAAPLYRGEPGYRSGLDRDGDGIACE